jgi:hypothetical protein
LARARFDGKATHVSGLKHPGDESIKLTDARCVYVS